MSEFQPFPKIPRYNRDIIITEKIDGTNAQVLIARKVAAESYPPISLLAYEDAEFAVWAGSRNRYLGPGQDNFGFYAWVAENGADIVRILGEGRHFGEWWGQGIQRGYGLDHRRFSLFNVSRWHHLNNERAREDNGVTIPLFAVPTLYTGPAVRVALEEDEYGDRHVLVSAVDEALDILQALGSHAAVGFDDPEGVIVFHTAGNALFKATIKDDEKPKSKA